MQQPNEVVARVAAIDVAKATGMTDTFLGAR